ncbi:glycosyltransferase family 2 protein [Facklamia hominis]|uniref:glycosyltransferase family 2 protein n=1 Tax=Facklamia hominis TaxID=178214 RepID=UPI000C7AF285|nr:glycosyltransferase family 2 protein [Facklamia hominis]PKY93793.1 hypothetical protein CYJ56_00870 [Facklamia hominis]
MDKNILLSIIIPVYNSDLYIKKLIESIITQSISFNIEVIVVNDGSYDETVNIVNKLILKDSRIKILHQANQGAPKARNYGLSHSNGKYVYFIDSDDCLEYDSLNKIYYYLSKFDPDLLLGSFDIIDNSEGVVENTHFKDCIFKESKKIVSQLENISPMPGNKIISRKLLNENDIWFSDVKIGQDLNFYLKYLPFCKNVVITSDILYNYYIRKNSISRTYSGTIVDIIDSIEEAQKFIESKNLTFKPNWDNIKLRNYYLQYSKIPLIENNEDRILTADLLYSNIKKIDLKSVDKEKNNILLKKLTVKSHLHWLYKSTIYSFLIRSINNLNR